MVNVPSEYCPSSGTAPSEYRELDGVVRRARTGLAAADDPS